MYRYEEKTDYVDPRHDKSAYQTIVKSTAPDIFQYSEDNFGKTIMDSIRRFKNGNVI